MKFLLTLESMKEKTEVPSRQKLVIALGVLLLLEYIGGAVFVIEAIGGIGNEQFAALAVMGCAEILLLLILGLFFGVCTLFYRQKMILRKNRLPLLLIAMLLSPLCGWLNREFLYYFLDLLFMQYNLHLSPINAILKLWPIARSAILFSPGVAAPYIIAIIFIGISSKELKHGGK